MKNPMFATNLKYLRNKKGLTQQDVSEAIGIKTSAWIKYEQGTYPDVAKLMLIAKFFNVSETVLLHINLEGPTSKSLSALEIKLDALEKERRRRS
jgi:transcriptional regulator with XRE-family HTH domain